MNHDRPIYPDLPPEIQHWRRKALRMPPDDRFKRHRLTLMGHALRADREDASFNQGLRDHVLRMAGSLPPLPPLTMPTAGAIAKWKAARSMQGKRGMRSPGDWMSG